MLPVRALAKLFSSRVGLLVLTLSPFLSACYRVSEPAEKPASKALRRDANVLLITIDTLRADYLSCYGNQKISTPNLDGLAARGVRFSQAVAQIPLTTPSHASILTGTYPQVHKLRDIGGFVLDQKVPTLASVVREAGFETSAIVGSTVLNRRFGLNKGFNSYFDDMREEKVIGRLPGVVAEIRAEIVTRHAIEWLEKSTKEGIGIQPFKKFFLWVHYYDPHFPYDPPGVYRARYHKDLYGGEVAYTDEQIGHLLKWLTDRLLLNRTLIVLLADHGESLGEHGEYSHGVFLYDSTMQIPLIVSGPDVPTGKVVTQQVRSIDVMPTIAEYLGLSPGSQVQGVSLMPTIAESKVVRSHYCYMESLYPKTHLGWSELRGLRTEEWKLIVAPRAELYQLGEDRNESQNVIDRFPADADRLQKQVWEIAGPPGSLGKLDLQPVDKQTQQELQSLGYLSAGSQRELRIDMTGPDPKDRVPSLKVIEQAGDLMNHDRFREAVPLLQGILHQDPTNPLIYQHLGLCFQRLGQFLKAVQLYQEAIQNKADTDQAHAELGEIYVRLGDRAHAIESMETAAKMNPTDLQNLNNLAAVYLEMGRLEDTERVLRAILAQNDRHSAAINLLGIVEVQRGHEELAREYFEKAITYNPELAQAYMNLGILAEEAGQKQLAISYYKKFLEKAEPKEHRAIIPKVKAALAKLAASS